jgi:hypothetical protein
MFARSSGLFGATGGIRSALSCNASFDHNNIEDSRSIMAHHHFVYIVLLSRTVLMHKRFLKANPSYAGDLPCVYVGMTGLDPDTRFDKHKAGIKANTYVRLYGQRLMPELVADLVQPMSYLDAKYAEVDVAIRLRVLGYAVWQA